MAAFLDDPGTFQEFMDKFLQGQVMFGKWTDHVKSWRHADLGDKILFTTYQEMVQNLQGTLGEFSTFLGTNLSQKTLCGIAEHCCFKNMSSNCMSNYSLVPKEYMDPSLSPFLRKGIVGDWKNHFSPEEDLQFSACIMGIKPLILAVLMPCVYHAVGIKPLILAVLMPLPVGIKLP
ncbi:unnamed protein product [Merluccius merluccius]